MPRRTIVDPRFAAQLRELLEARGMSFRALSARTYYSKSYLHDVASGKKAPTPDFARRLDEIMGAGGKLAALVTTEERPATTDDEFDALELARRVTATDIGEETLSRLEQAVDELARAYATNPPEELLHRVRRHLAYVGKVLDARATLRQRRRLLVAAGWLSLLTATIHIDLRNSAAADARLATAAQLAKQAEHPEISAWCLETRAWEVLSDGDYPQAVDLSRTAQSIAPRGSSVLIQATAQEGRAWARLHDRQQTRDALDRVERLTSSLPIPDQPEHHYRYDPDKALSYTATTLAWADDPTAEEYARALIRQLEGAANGAPRPRRVAAARLDLARALLAAGKPDEAVAETTVAITSGRVVPSNWWRVTEILQGVQVAGIAEAAGLREICREYHTSGGA